MNTVLSPSGLPAYLAHASCHSVSNHPSGASRLFFVHIPSARRCCPARLRLFKATLPSGTLGATGRTSHSTRRLVPPIGRIEFTSLHDYKEHCYGLAVHLRQLPTPSRHDAVAFGHR